MTSGLDSTLVSVVSNGANICRVKHKYLVYEQSDLDLYCSLYLLIIRALL